MQARYYLSTGGVVGSSGSINLHNGEATFVARNPDFNEPGRVRLTLVVIGQSASQRADTTNAILRLLRRAPLALAAGSAVTLSVQRHPGLRWLHYDLLGTTGGEDPERGLRVTPDGRHAELDLDLRTTRYPRTDPVTLAIPGTLAGATAAFLMPEVPGSIPALARLALDDTSATGVINRVRLATITGTFTAATQYTAWVDAPATAPAINTSQAGTLGGQYAAHPSALTGLTHQEVARAVQPAGTSQRGLLDGYLRVMGTGTPVGTPGSLTGTAQRDGIALGTGGSGISTLLSSSVSTNSFTRVAGSTLVAFVKADYASGGFVSVSGFTQVAAGMSGLGFDDTATPGSELLWGVFVAENVAAGTGTVTANFGVNTFNKAIRVYQILNAAELSLDSTASDIGASTVGLSVQNTPAVLLGAAMVAGWTSSASVSTGGAATVGNGMATSVRTVTRPMALTVSGTASTNSEGFALAALTILQEPASETQQLDAGTYIARVQAEDAAGYRGNAVQGTATAGIDQNSIVWTWPAVANAESYVLTIQFAGRNYEVKTEAITYNLTTLDGLPEVAALPALSGAVAPPPFVRARVGTVNDHTFSRVVPDEVTLAGSGSYELVPVFARQQLPPSGPSLVDSWQDWAVPIDARSANGQAATVRVDGLWVVPSDSPQLEAHIHGRLYASKRRWILESLRDGIGATGRLAHLVSGVEQGRLTVRGNLLLPPGATIVLLAFEQEGGAHSFSAQVTATLTYWPRVRWELGAA